MYCRTSPIRATEGRVQDLFTTPTQTYHPQLALTCLCPLCLLLPFPLLVAALVESLDPSVVMSVFRCATFASADDFLTALATKQGKFAKGGTPNTVSAARTLIRQWNEAQIPHYTAPPQLDDGEEGVMEAGAGLGGMFRVANQAMVAELREREESGGEEKRYIVLEESLFADEGEDEEDEEDEEMEEEEGAADDKDDEEAAEQEEEKEEEEEAKDTDAAAEGQDEDEEMDDQDEDEIELKPSPLRTRRNQQQRSPALSITTQLAAIKHTKQQPLLTPSRTQQRKERKPTTEERKEAERQVDAGAVDIEVEEEVVSEPDSPAKNTRSRRQKSAAPSAPPIAALTTPRRSARGKSNADQQTISDIGSTVQTRARRK